MQAIWKGCLKFSLLSPGPFPGSGLREAAA